MKKEEELKKLITAIHNGYKISSELAIEKPFNKVAKQFYETMKEIESLLSDHIG